jgi:Cu(I)/Ag(I) efflux system membrane protein CusA/SilA
MWLLGYNMSVAVAIGFIALAGVAAETGAVMLIYLDHAYREHRERGPLATRLASMLRWRKGQSSASGRR